MPLLTLDQFPEAKRMAFRGWETARTINVDPPERYVEPVDARYGGPRFVLGTDPSRTPAIFLEWCANELAGEYFTMGGAPWGALVYCRLQRDVDKMLQAFKT